MKTNEIKKLFQAFENIVCEYNGIECRNVGELQKYWIGYNARRVCNKSESEIHFA